MASSPNTPPYLAFISGYPSISLPWKNCKNISRDKKIAHTKENINKIFTLIIL